MTQDVRKRPAGAWAVAVQIANGQYGVAIGCGEEQIGFVAEGDFDAYISAGTKIEGDDFDLELLRLFIRAALTLPEVKAAAQRRADKAASN